jgi:hypothetical protein
LERKKIKGEIEIIEDVFECDESTFRLFHEHVLKFLLSQRRCSNSEFSEERFAQK